MGQARIGQKLSRLAVVVVKDQDTARQDAQRPLDDAHVLVQYQMMDVGAVEQGADGGDQHHVVGSDQFPQMRLSCADWAQGGCATAATIVNRFVPLPL